MLHFFTLFVSLTLAANWDYAENGPSEWHRIDSRCSGNRQSPIDIRDSNIQNAYPVCVDKHRYFDWKFVYEHNTWKVENSGHALKLTPVRDLHGTPIGRGNSVSRFYNELYDEFKNTEPQQYCLDQVHFHVGRDSCEGSEHLLEGKSFPLEVHWVHSLCEYEDIGAAVASGKENALSVIGMFFLVGEDNLSIETIVNEKNINSLINTGDSFISDTISMKHLVPCDDGMCAFAKETFWFYDGSLTTPGCNEQVRWQIFKDTQPISKFQLQLLYRMEQPDGTQYGKTSTFRPPAGLKNNRPLNYVYEDKNFCTQSS